MISTQTIASGIYYNFKDIKMLQPSKSDFDSNAVLGSASSIFNKAGGMINFPLWWLENKYRYGNEVDDYNYDPLKRYFSPETITNIQNRLGFYNDYTEPYGPLTHSDYIDQSLLGYMMSPTLNNKRWFYDYYNENYGKQLDAYKNHVTQQQLDSYKNDVISKLWWKTTVPILIKKIGIPALVGTGLAYGAYKGYNYLKDRLSDRSLARSQQDIATDPKLSQEIIRPKVNLYDDFINNYYNQQSREILTEPMNAGITKTSNDYRIKPKQPTTLTLNPADEDTKRKIRRLAKGTY